MKTKKYAVPVAVLFGALALSACTPGSEPSSGSNAPVTGATAGGTRTAVGFAQFPDIAVPGGAKMDVERTLVLGTRDAWIGRLAMSSGGGVTSTYDFFLREMPKFHWQEITAVRSEVSVLTYAREDRVATVQIRPRTLGGSLIDITVSPRGKAQPVPPGGTVTNGFTGSAAPPGPVTSQPIR